MFNLLPRHVPIRKRESSLKMELANSLVAYRQPQPISLQFKLITGICENGEALGASRSVFATGEIVDKSDSKKIASGHLRHRRCASGQHLASCGLQHRGRRAECETGWIHAGSLWLCGAPGDPASKRIHVHRGPSVHSVRRPTPDCADPDAHHGLGSRWTTWHVIRWNK